MENNKFDIDDKRFKKVYIETISLTLVFLVIIFVVGILFLQKTNFHPLIDFLIAISIGAFMHYFTWFFVSYYVRYRVMKIINKNS